jgi:hypothetical protein
MHGYNGYYYDYRYDDDDYQPYDIRNTDGRVVVNYSHNGRRLFALRQLYTRRRKPTSWWVVDCELHDLDCRSDQYAHAQYVAEQMFGLPAEMRSQYNDKGVGRLLYRGDPRLRQRCTLSEALTALAAMTDDEATAARMVIVRRRWATGHGREVITRQDIYPTR